MQDGLAQLHVVLTILRLIDNHLVYIEVYNRKARAVYNRKTICKAVEGQGLGVVLTCDIATESKFPVWESHLSQEGSR